MPAQLNNDNGFVDSLKSHWKADARVLLISAEPGNPERNDMIMDMLRESFLMSGLPIGGFWVCDERNEEIVRSLSSYDVVILSGGHVPTQNAFFHKLRLQERMKTFDGIVIGISAGTMNSAEIVYAQPELEGESTDKEYQRFLPGMGITTAMILPHYQAVREAVLDGKRLIEDITLPDSFGKTFYALVDGSYVLILDGKQILYGEGYLLADGTIRQICKKGEHICIG